MEEKLYDTLWLFTAEEKKNGITDKETVWKDAVKRGILDYDASAVEIREYIECIESGIKYA